MHGIFRRETAKLCLNKKFASLSRLQGRGAEPPPPSADGGTPLTKSSARGELLSSDSKRGRPAIEGVPLK